MRLAAIVFAILVSALMVRLYPARAVTPALQAGGVPASDFRVYDATLYRNKPDPSGLGIRPMRIIYSSQFWPGGTPSDCLPDQATVRQLALDVASQAEPVVLDIEHWPLQGEANTVQTSITRYLQILYWFHDAAPGLRLGYYGAPPIRDYWRSIQGTQASDYQAWSSENLRLTALAATANVIYPSLYTFYADQAGWVAYAEAQIREARRYGKPVYVFLWPQYHDSNTLLGGQYLPADFWRLQLETARRLADGIVIWGGWAGSGPADWDEAAPWWQATRDFMVQQGL